MALKDRILLIFIEPNNDKTFTMNKIYYLIFLISFLFVSPNMIAQMCAEDPIPAEECDIFSLLPEIGAGSMSTDFPPVPCGFTSPEGVYVNECSPCGSKISDDDCTAAPNPTLCELDGFQTTTTGYTNDVFNPSLGFCGGGTGTHNNFWIGFTAQSNVIELLITTENCADAGNARGIQVAIVDTDCNNFFQTMSNGGQPACFGAVGQGGLFNSSTTLLATNLIPNAPYYILVDGFAGGVCDLQIDVLDGFEEPLYDVFPVPPAQLCPDILNDGEFTAQDGSGAQVFVTTGGVATTDLTFFWLNPAGDVIATTGPDQIVGNQVIGALDGSFFTETGTYSVQIIDNGSCCPLCSCVDLEIADPPPAAAAIISGTNGQDMLNCTNDLVVLEGNPEDESTPSIEQWQIINAMGDRQIVVQSLISATGRVNVLDVDRDVIEAALPGQLFGTATFVYGFLGGDLALGTFGCFGDAAIEIPFDFRDPEIDIDTPGDIDCMTNPTVELDASDTETFGHDATYEWTFQDGTTNGIVSGGDSPIAVVQAAGFFMLTVTDNENGCTSEQLIEVEGMVDPPTLDPIPAQILNCNNNNQVTLTSTGDPSVSNISYSWSGPNGVIAGANGLTLDVTMPGTYVLTATNNDNSCSIPASVTVEQDMPDITIDAFDPLVITCTDMMVSSPDAVVNEMDPGTYTYSWTNAGGDEVATTAALTTDVAGTFTLTVTDMDSGCPFTQTITVTEDNDLPQIATLDPLTLNCMNSEMQSATAVATDAAGDPISGVTYEWMLDGDPTVLGTNADFDFTVEGDYIVVVTNPATGCSSMAPIAITLDNDEPDGAVAMPDAITCNAPMITLMGSSMDDVTYEWFEGDENGTSIGTAAGQEVSAAGSYTLVLTSNTNGCTTIVPAMVMQNDTDPNPMIATPDVLNCTTMADGLTLDGSGSTGANAMSTLSYSWTDPVGDPIGGNDAMIDVTEVGTYILTVTDDDNGCTMSMPVTVIGDFTEPATPTLTGGTILCTDTDFTITSSITSTGNYTFCWTDAGNNIFPPGETLTVISGGEYTLTVKDMDNGCTSSATTMVDVDADTPDILPILISGTTGPINCNNPSLTYEGQLGAGDDPNVIDVFWILPDMTRLNQSTITINENSMPGAYMVFAENSINGCDNMGGITPLFDFDQPEIEALGGTIFCAPNDAVTLSATSTGTDEDAESYIWMGPDGMLSETDNDVIVTTPGPYTVIGVGENGCQSAPFQIMVDDNNDDPVVSVAEATLVLSCRPGEDMYSLGGGATTSNVTDQLDFEWTLGGNPIADSSNPNATVSEPGIYTLTVTNAVSGCQSTATVEVTDIRRMPELNFSPNRPLDCNNPDAIIDGAALYLLGTQPNFEYVWTSEMGIELMDQNPTVSETGMWTVVATDPENGCMVTGTVEVIGDFDIPTGLQIMGDSQITCQTGSVQLSGSAIEMDVTYLWSLDTDPGFELLATSMNSSINASQAGVYTMTVTGSNGCPTSTTFEVFIDEDTPTVMAEVMNTITCDMSTATIEAESNSMNANFEWTGPTGFVPTSGESINVTLPGTYTLIVTDNINGCEAPPVEVMVLDDREDPDVATMTTVVTCEDMIFSISASSMVNNAMYSWSGQGLTGTDPILEVTQAGSYEVIVTDPSNGCSTPETVIVTADRDDPDGSVSASVMELNCDNSESLLTATSSTAGVIITFMDEAMNETVDDELMVTQAGVYMVTYEDPASGCSITEPIEITEDFTPPNIAPVVPVQDLNCDIMQIPLEITINGNESIRTYEWTGPGLDDPTAASPLASAPGLYTLIVTADDNGCTNTISIEVMQDIDMPVSVPAATEITCENPDAQLMGEGSSLGGDIVYLWEGPGGFTSSDISTTTTVSGQYTLTVSNSTNMCSVSEIVMVGEDMNAPIADAGAQVDFPCAVDEVTLDGSASSGQATLSYEWTNSTGLVVGNAAVIQVSESGEFTLTITDSDNGCTNFSTVMVVPDEDAPIIDVAPVQTLTCGTPTISLDASNTIGAGTGMLQYSWTFENGMPAGNDAVIDVSNPGIYTLTVTDLNNGCEASMPVPVDENMTLPAFTVEGGDLDCASGVTDVTVQGLLANNPSYSWTGPGGFVSTDPMLSNVDVAGTYTLTVTDGDNGCTFTSSAEVTPDDNAPPASIGPADMLACDTEVIQLTGMTSGSGLTFLWSGPGIISNPDNLTIDVNTPGMYQLVVTDPSNGCTTVSSIQVEEVLDDLASFGPEADDVNCFGPNTGSIAIPNNAITGGTAPYLFSIDGGQTFSTQSEFLGLTAGEYNVVVQDANGCELPSTVTVDPALELFIDLGENQVVAFGDSINLSSQQNFDIATITWSDTTLIGPNPNTGFLTNTITYEVMAFDDDGCPTTDNITIFVEKTRPVFIPTAFSPDGDGINELFTVYADIDLITSIRSFSIYDRWGEQMYFAGNMTPEMALGTGWDGMFRTEEMNPGVYVYHVLVEFADGEEIFYEGDFTLFR